jgi:hypothetical protein
MPAIVTAMNSLRCFSGLVVCLGLIGCASTPKRSPVLLTGDIMVDGPRAIADGPRKDRLLWEYRTAAAAMRLGRFDQAKSLLDDAMRTLNNIYGTDESARQARSYFHEESKKTFIGEPYERAMAYFYRGILYWRDGEPDNARACFRSAQFQDSDTENREYAGDYVLFDYLDGLVTAKLHGDGSDAFKRAEKNAKGVNLPPHNPAANVIFFVEYGPGPTKYAAGRYGEQLHFRTLPTPVHSARLTVGSLVIPVAPVDDLNFQATTRGGRVMDHILGNKAVFKATTDTAGDAALIAGLVTAGSSHDRSTQNIGLGIAAAGLLSKIISSATTPDADTRSWDNLPQRLSFAAVPLPVGQHAMTMEFLDPSGRPIASLTKILTVNVATADRDTVVFVSDQSSTPQTL